MTTTPITKNCSSFLMGIFIDQRALRKLHWEELMFFSSGQGIRRTVVRVEVGSQSLVWRAACRYHTLYWPRPTATVAHVFAEAGLEVGTLTFLSPLDIVRTNLGI
jgi:hypothetical protein